MYKNKKSFSIIEILIATAILTIAVFGVYKLIGENRKIIREYSNKNINYLFLDLKECLANLGISKNETGYIDLKNCSKSNFQTGIIINSNNYFLYFSGISDNIFYSKIFNDEFHKIKRLYLK